MSRFYCIPSDKIRAIRKAIEARKYSLWDRFLDWEWFS